MNADEHAVFRRQKRDLKVMEAQIADLILENMSLPERVEADALVDDGVATTDEIYEGLALGIET